MGTFCVESNRRQSFIKSSKFEENNCPRQCQPYKEFGGMLYSVHAICRRCQFVPMYGTWDVMRENLLLRSKQNVAMTPIQCQMSDSRHEKFSPNLPQEKRKRNCDMYLWNEGLVKGDSMMLCLSWDILSVSTSEQSNWSCNQMDDGRTSQEV